ncbi:McrC family protein [Paenibacillus sp. MMS20-IR301]|uniref:McrC family protein n=1 Tax=Paenibacillus sp. MMS20-IR301 TaxID=2895946 RepID=UPI0028EBAF91|nr:McrC family protein [Paenibacillus sp. MMS20-IR301]WNS42036.1 McrC family protein [Paenibacillus sp. MMS20-IR301]
MKHLTVTECFGSIPISDSLTRVSLTAAEADELAHYVSASGLDETEIIFSRYEVTFINYVGFIQLRGCSIEILPKVAGDDPAQSRRVLLRMLQRSGFLDIHESQAGWLQLEKLNLFEIIAYLFTEKISCELRKGIYRSYQHEDGELQLVRGKINLSRQLRRDAMKLPGVSCTYDEFQVSNPLNQILKTGLQLITARSRYFPTKKRATDCLLLMDDVTGPPLTLDQMDRVWFDRTNRRYQESFQLAKLLLRQSTPTASPGGSKNSSILFKMNELFEAYIAYLARNIWDQVTIKDRSHKLLVREGSTRGVFQLEPDLLVVNGQGKSVILDTKWKMIHSQRSRHGVKREDFYQMYAYLTRYQAVEEVLLLYPHHEGIVSSGTCLESWHLEGEPGKKLKVYSIHYEEEELAEQELRTMIG